MKRTGSLPDALWLLSTILDKVIVPFVFTALRRRRPVRHGVGELGKEAGLSWRCRRPRCQCGWHGAEAPQAALALPVRDSALCASAAHHAVPPHRCQQRHTLHVGRAHCAALADQAPLVPARLAGCTGIALRFQRAGRPHATPCRAAASAGPRRRHITTCLTASRAPRQAPRGVPTEAWPGAAAATATATAAAETAALAASPPAGCRLHAPAHLRHARRVYTAPTQRHTKPPRRSVNCHFISQRVTSGMKIELQVARSRKNWSNLLTVYVRGKQVRAARFHPRWVAAPGKRRQPNCNAPACRGAPAPERRIASLRRCHHCLARTLHSAHSSASRLNAMR